MILYYKKRKGRKKRKGLYVKKILTIYLVFVLALTSQLTVLASSDPLTVVNNLSEFIFGLIRAIGMILLRGQMDF